MSVVLKTFSMMCWGFNTALWVKEPLHQFLSRPFIVTQIDINYKNASAADTICGQVAEIFLQSTHLDGIIFLNPKKILPSGKEIMPPLTFLINLCSSSPIGCSSLLPTIKILICCALKCLLDKVGAQSSLPVSRQTCTFLQLVLHIHFHSVVQRNHVSDHSNWWNQMNIKGWQHLGRGEWGTLFN